MKRAEGGRNPEPIVCLNPVKGLWRVRLAITETEDGAEWMEHDFDHRPIADEVRSLFVELVNERVQQSILTGFVYEGCPVYLSMENQVTFRNSMTCPVRLKLGEAADGSPVYYEFTSASKLTAFQKAVGNYIQQCLDEGWTEKDAFDVEPYLRE